MRVTKGLWAALGAGTSLAAAALLALATMGVVLAVGGWPSGRYVSHDGSVALQAQRAAATQRPATTAAKPAARARTHPAAPRHAGRQVALDHPTAHRPVSATPAPKAGAPAAAPSTGSAPASSGPGSGATTTTTTPVTKVTQTVTAPVTKVTATVGTTVTKVTDTAGTILDPVSPTVGQTLTQTGQQAGQTIDEVGQTVGGIVGGLTGGK
jgi:hypothetical protein